MSLKQTIQKNLTEAQKASNESVVETLRMLLAVINSKEKEKRYNFTKSRLDRGSTTESGEKPEATEQDLVKESELTEEQIIESVSSEIKKRKDAIVLYEKGERPELAQKEKQEIEILKKYLPEQLSEEELKKLVKESVEKTGAKEMKDMGKVMTDLNPKIKGKADGGEVSRMVKDILGTK
jgi:hypothetical protein